MPNDDKNAKHKMIKRVETKEDGRLLIFYSFESSSDRSEPEAAVEKEALPKEAANKVD